MEGVLFGLTAALSWGVTDSLAAIVSRRLTALRTAAYSLLVSVTVLGLALAGTDAWQAIDASFAVRVGAVGAVACIANLALWQALRMGPVSVVSPIAGTVGAFTVLLAMLLLDERPAPLQLVAVPVAATGSILAALVRQPDVRRPSLVGGGVLLALVAVVAYALVGVLLRDPIRESGWLPAAFVSRSSNTALMWVFLVISTVAHRRGADAEVGTPPRRSRLLPALLILGLTDVCGMAAFSIGLETSPAWLVGLVASMGPVIGIVVGLSYFDERLGRSQWLGLGLIAVALVLVALG